MNKKIIVMLAIPILLLSGSVNGVESSLIGVEVGTTFNLKIAENTIIYEQVELMISALAEMDESGNLTEMLTGFEFNESMLPKKGDVFAFNVTSLPTFDITTDTFDNESIREIDGNLTVTFENETHELTTGFILGTPVVFTAWSFWGEAITNMTDLASEAIENSTDLSGFELSSVINYETGDYFESTITIEVPIDLIGDILTEELGGLAEIVNASFVHFMSYEKSTGILESMSIKFITFTKITLNGETSTTGLTQELSIARTEDTENTETDTGSSANGFGILMAILAVPVLLSKRK